MKIKIPDTGWTRLQQPRRNKHKAVTNKDLGQDSKVAYKPAYKQNQKTGQNEPVEIPPELAEIVAVWPELPKHIKQAIKALTQTHITEENK